MNILLLLKNTDMHERLGVEYLSAALKSAGGFNVDLAITDSLSEEQLIARVAASRPQVIGYSAMTGEHTRLIEINNLLKKQFSFIAVFGGPHATYFPGLLDEENVDAICLGEGEAVFVEFCRRVRDGGRYYETENFLAKYAGRIYRNPLRDLIADLDTITFPDRELMYRADPGMLDEPHRFVFSSRGCPYKCTYCFNQKYNAMYAQGGKIVRYRSPRNFIAEIVQLKNNYGITFVWIDDDTFLLKPDSWFDEFCALYREQVNLPFSCNVRANLVNESIIARLRATGLTTIWMGVECGDEQVANAVLGRELTNAQLCAAAAIINRHNIKLFTQNLVGLPVPDSFATDKKTVQLNISLKPTYAWSSILYPYPGTKIKEYAAQHGFIDAAFHDVLETNKSLSSLNFSPREKRKIEHLHKLFNLFVRYPFLFRFCDALCALPLTKLYTMVYYLIYGYYFKFKIVGYKSLGKELPKYFRVFCKLIKAK